MNARFTVSRAALAPAIDFAARVTDPKSVLPILGHVIISAGGDHVRITGSNMMISGEVSIPADVSSEGSLAISGEQLAKIAKGLSAADIEFVGLDNFWVEVRAGRSQYKVAGLPPGDFPELPNPETELLGKSVEWTSVHAPTFVALLQTVSPAMCADESRANLHGTYFKGADGRTDIVATDGHRLSKIATDAPFPDCGTGVLLPRPGVLEIIRMLSGNDGDMEIGIGKRFVFFRSQNRSLSVQVSNTQFPPYGQVIPKVRRDEFEVSSESILRGLRSVQLLSNKSANIVTLTLRSGSFTMTRDDPDRGVAEYDADIDYDGDEFAIRFNGDYLEDAVKGSGADNVRIEFQGPLDPLVVKADDFVGVVMPMRQ